MNFSREQTRPMKGNSTGISEVRFIRLFVRKNLLSQPVAFFVLIFIQLIEKLHTNRRIYYLFEMRYRRI